MRILSLDEYFEYIALDPPSQQNPQCELCGTSDQLVLRDTARINDDLRVKFSMVCCRNCAHLYQLPRFDERFYRSYYNSAYRRILSGSQASVVEDQISRGEHIYRSLEPYLPEKGTMLDVGASAGGIMMAFRKRGWDTYGTDPDVGYVAYGIRNLQADLTVACAEDMKLEPNAFDFILITGSLEHVFDSNKVLAICRRASKQGALLFLEGRGLALTRKNRACGHSHRRFLTQASIRLFMNKHGWSPMWTTDQELSGPTRPLSVFGLGQSVDAPPPPDGRCLVPESCSKANLADVVRQFDAWGIE